MKVLVLGINGFIGTHLALRILEETDWTITGFDLRDDNMYLFGDRKRLAFRKGDIFTENAWLAEAVASHDVIIPLAGVARPATYVKRPLYVYELDYEQNLKIVRLCAEHGKRLIFPSTSEVYGMSPDKELFEDDSPLMQGPIRNSRWIYSCSKQMIDRVIAAYGAEMGLRYTCFRPFNWMGARLDSFDEAVKNEARAVTQFLYNILERRPVRLVNAGVQRRSFTHIDDGTAGLMAILQQETHANGEIFNIGNPANNASVRELAESVREAVKEHEPYRERAEQAVIEVVDAQIYYGKGYEDVEDRRPSVQKAREMLGWEPVVDFNETVRRCVAASLKEYERWRASR